MPALTVSHSNESMEALELYSNTNIKQYSSRCFSFTQGLQITTNGIETPLPPGIARHLSDLRESLINLQISNKALSHRVVDDETEDKKITLVTLARIHNLGQTIQVIKLVLKLSDDLATARNEVVAVKHRLFDMELQNVYCSISHNIKQIIEICDMFPNDNPREIERNVNRIRASLLTVLTVCEKFANADDKIWFNNRMFSWSRSVLRQVYEARIELPYKFGYINEMYLIEDEH